MKTPQEQFEALPPKVQELVADIAARHGIEPSDLFPDAAMIARQSTADLARREAAQKLFQHNSVAIIAEWFGVSKVTINKCVHHRERV